MAGLMSRRLDVDALRALVAIEKHGGVTRAAEILRLVAVGRQPQDQEA